MYLQGFFSICNLSNLPCVKSNIGSDTEKLYMHRARVRNSGHVVCQGVPSKGRKEKGRKEKCRKY